MTRRAILFCSCASLLLACSDDSKAPTPDRVGTARDGASEAVTPSPDGKPSNEKGTPSPDQGKIDGGASGCLAECQQTYDYLCVKDSSGACRACLGDQHCQANPRADGPYCDVANKLCVCKVAADCAASTVGHKCLMVGKYLSCTCETDADCGASYSVCGGTAIKRCEKPCKSNADCVKGGFTGTCDVPTGKCSYE